MLKGALIGCGFFAENHLHAWHDVEGAEIVAICDRDHARLDHCGEKFAISGRFDDVAQMLASGSFDFVDIATTVTSHRPLVELAARHGLHVICQKPLAENLADASAMVNAVEGAGKTFMVHENFRWQSAIRSAIGHLRDGAIGTPFFARVSFRSGYDVYAGQPYLATDKRFIIQDLGIHILDIARAIMGEVNAVTATINRVNPAIVGEDVATMMLQHHSGFTSIVDCSYATRRTPETFPETLLEIDGADGSLRLDAGYRLSIQRGNEHETHDLSPPLLPWASKPWHNVQESVLIIQQHFVDSIRDGVAPETSGRDNLQTLALVEGAYRSAAEGRTVDLTDMLP